MRVSIQYTKKNIRPTGVDDNLFVSVEVVKRTEYFALFHLGTQNLLIYRFQCRGKANMACFALVATKIKGGRSR